MAWRDQLRPASFRGVAFKVLNASRIGGRKVVVHDYPYRDVPFAEDLGRRPREHRIDAYLVGREYFADRDALVAALETAGPGELVHPYLGTLQVSIPTFTVDEDTSEGGVVRITFEAVETPKDPFAPLAATSPSATAAKSTEKARLVSRDRFSLRYGLTLPPSVAAGATLQRKLPAFSFTSVANVVRAATTVVPTARKALYQALSPVIRGTQGLAFLKRSFDTIFNDATRLVREPFELSGRMLDVMRSLGTLPTTPRLGISALLEAYHFDPGPAPASTTPVRQAERRNYDATVGLIRQLIVIEAAGLAAQAATAPAGAGFDSFQDAVAMQQAIAELLDAEAALADDTTYGALTQLRADLVAAVPGAVQPARRLLTVVPPVTVPALTLTHRLYGDITPLEDLITRNRLRHPAFVLGGRPLQVLARE